MKSAKLAKITVRDIQNTKIVTDFDCVDNRIRKSWVLQMPASVTVQLKAIAQKQRFELYKTLDEMVRQEWVKMMRNYHTEAIKKGAKTISGTQVLEKDCRIDTDELLIDAGRVIVHALLDGKITLPKA